MGAVRHLARHRPSRGEASRQRLVSVRQRPPRSSCEPTRYFATRIEAAACDASNSSGAGGPPLEVGGFLLLVTRRAEQNFLPLVPRDAALDIFRRYAVGWMLALRGFADLASRLLGAALRERRPGSKS